MDLEELLLYYIIIIIIFGEKFDYPVNSIIRTGAGPVESGLPSFYCTATALKTQTTDFAYYFHRKPRKKCEVN